MVLIADRPARRLDSFLSAQLTDLSRSRIQQLLASGDITVDGSPARAADAVRPGQRIDVRVQPRPDTTQATAEDLPLQILFEDEHLLCLDKPPGMVVHPAAGNWSGTLVNALLHHCRTLSSAGGPVRPGIVHRLDKETSGCLLVAKTDHAHQALAAQFAARTTTKIYLAVCRGPLRPPSGTIDAPLARHPIHRKIMAVSTRPGAREAVTGYRTLLQRGNLALVECRPLTGRTHQIRVHLKHLGHPICGDHAYGGGRSFPRHLLHAWQIEVRHPGDGRLLHFTAPVPDDFPFGPE